MGPHWNPMTGEIAVTLRGRGMVHVVCPSTIDETECKNSRFRVEEGDVFMVPRYHPMAQISFNNESFVFVGFTTTQKNNHPQYLVGSASVFQALDKKVLATSLGVSNTTMDEILSAQREAIILECTSCAEEEERLWKAFCCPYEPQAKVSFLLSLWKAFCFLYNFPLLMMTEYPYCKLIIASPFNKFLYK